MLSHELNPLFIDVMLHLGPPVSEDFGYFIAICCGHSVFGFTIDRIVRIGLFSHNKLINGNLNKVRYACFL